MDMHVGKQQQPPFYIVWKARKYANRRGMKVQALGIQLFRVPRSMVGKEKTIASADFKYLQISVDEEVDLVTGKAHCACVVSNFSNFLSEKKIINA